MRRAGTVVGIAQGVAVVRCPDERYPGFGRSVIDEALRTVGTVVDVFGPVDRPYLVVSPDGSAELATLLGTVLYVREE